MAWALEDKEYALSILKHKQGTLSCSSSLPSSDANHIEAIARDKVIEQIIAQGQPPTSDVVQMLTELFTVFPTARLARVTVTPHERKS